MGSAVSRIEVSLEVFHWAIARGGTTLARLEKKFPKIREWEAGASYPTLHQLENFARATHTPFGYFFLDNPPDDRLPIPHFRTIADGPPPEPSPDLLETVYAMQRRQEWMREYLLEQGVEPLPFIRSARPRDPLAAIAERMRQVVHLEKGWAAACPTWEDALRVLRAALEQAGVLIVGNSIVENDTHRKLNPEEFRGFVLVDEIAPLVFLNTADAKAAQMFTLAHEMAHLAFGSSAAFDLRRMEPADDPGERACNRVAAEFLVPEEQLRGIWPSLRGDPEPFQALARRFKVSVLVAARRALDLGLIPREGFFEFYKNYLSDERRKTALAVGRPDFYKNQNLRVGRVFASAVARAVGEGKLLYSQAYRLTGLYGAAFQHYTNSLHTGAAR